MFSWLYERKPGVDCKAWCQPRRRRRNKWGDVKWQNGADRICLQNLCSTFHVADESVWSLLNANGTPWHLWSSGGYKWSIPTDDAPTEYKSKCWMGSDVQHVEWSHTAVWIILLYKVFWHCWLSDSLISHIQYMLVRGHCKRNWQEMSMQYLGVTCRRLGQWNITLTSVILVVDLQLFQREQDTIALCGS